MRRFTSMTTERCRGIKSTQWSNQAFEWIFIYHLMKSCLYFCAHCPKPTSSGAPGLIHISHSAQPWPPAFFLPHLSYNACSSYFGLCLCEGKYQCSWGLAVTCIQTMVSAYFLFFFSFFSSVNKDVYLLILPNLKEMWPPRTVIRPTVSLVPREATTVVFSYNIINKKSCTSSSWDKNM